MMVVMLKPNSERILKAIISRSPDERHNLSISEIAAAAYVTEKTVRTHIKSLVKHNYISVSRRNLGVSYSFTIGDQAIKELGNHGS